MELHVVFYNKEYGSQKNALKYENGLTVLAFFFSISHKPNPSYVEVSKLLQQITNPYTNASFEEPLALEDFMHTDMNDFYVYNGSLTTPPCLEVVTWLDFYLPIQISHKQVKKILYFFSAITCVTIFKKVYFNVSYTNTFSLRY